MEKYQQLQANDHSLVFDRTVKNEQRKHPRYKMKKILSINKDILAEVVDISGSGISCTCLGNIDKPFTKINQIELLNFELGTSVKGLHCRLVRSSNNAISPGSLSTIVMNFSLEFQYLTQTKRRQLFKFIKDDRMLKTL